MCRKKIRQVVVWWIEKELLLVLAVVVLLGILIGYSLAAAQTKSYTSSPALQSESLLRADLGDGEVD